MKHGNFWYSFRTIFDEKVEKIFVVYIRFTFCKTNPRIVFSTQNYYLNDINQISRFIFRGFQKISHFLQKIAKNSHFWWFSELRQLFWSKMLNCGPFDIKKESFRAPKYSRYSVVKTLVHFGLRKPTVQEYFLKSSQSTFSLKIFFQVLKFFSEMVLRRLGIWKISIIWINVWIDVMCISPYLRISYLYKPFTIIRDRSKFIGYQKWLFLKSKILDFQIL